MADILTPKQGSASIGATQVTQFNEVAATLFRDVGYIKNTSTGAQIISIGDGVDAVSGQGIVLYPNEVWVDSFDGYHTPTQNRINVIADGAGGAISFYEKLRVR